jgi:hypothetical protein
MFQSAAARCSIAAVAGRLAQERPDVPHGQRNLLRHVLVRIQAHLRVGREHRHFHRHRAGMGRDVVGQDEDRRLAGRHEVALRSPRRCQCGAHSDSHSQ